MKTLQTLVREVAGLFVEDRWFALAIALWLAFALAAIAARDVPSALRGPLLFAGLALILIVSVARAARNARSERGALTKPRARVP